MKTAVRPAGRRAGRRAVVALVALAASYSLVGCSEVKEAATSATCTAAKQAVDAAQREAEKAIDELAVDPAAARQTLQGVRAALTAARAGLSAEQQEQVDAAREATDALLAQARSSAAGSGVDGQAVADARDDLLGAVTTVRDAC